MKNINIKILRVLKNICDQINHKTILNFIKFFTNFVLFYEYAL